MTATVEPITATHTAPQMATAAVVNPAHFVTDVSTNGLRTDRRNVFLVIPAWIAAVVFGLALVAYGFGPLFHQREQGVIQKQVRGIGERCGQRGQRVWRRHGAQTRAEDRVGRCDDRDRRPEAATRCR